MSDDDGNGNGNGNGGMCNDGMDGWMIDDGWVMNEW